MAETATLGSSTAPVPAHADTSRSAFAAARAAAARDRDERLLLRLLTGLLLVTVLGQRFAVPVGSMPVALPLLALWVTVALTSYYRLVRHDAVRTEFFVLAAAACCTAAWLATFPGEPLSVTSLVLLLVLWAPWALTVRRDLVPVAARLGRRFVLLMTVVAVAAVGQMVAQLTGLWAWEDYLTEWVSRDWLVQGFNVSIPVVYDSPIHKSNGLVLLEPSFLSQLCAVAVVVALVLRRPAWQILVLGLGIVVSLSGTGIVLLAAGLAVLLVRRPRLVRPGYVVAVAAAVAVVLLSPAGALLQSRIGETSEQGSSGYLRFVAPYTEVARGLDVDPLRYLVGAGPGTSERLLESDRVGAGTPVVYTIAPKLAFEYGLVAAAAFCAFLGVCLWRRPPWAVVPSAVAVMLLLLSGSLLQPHTVVLAWLLTSLWGSGGRAGGAEV